MNDVADRRSVLLASTAALVTVFFWASAFVAIRHVGHDFGPGALALGRLVIGTVVLGAVVLVRRFRAPGDGGTQAARPEPDTCDAAGAEPGGAEALAATPRPAAAATDRPVAAPAASAPAAAAPAVGAPRSAMSRTEIWVRLIVIGVLWFGVYNVSLNAAERRVDAGTASMLVNVGPILIAVLAGLVLREGFSRQLVAGIGIAFSGVVVIGLATSDGGGSDVWGVIGCIVAAIVYSISVVTQKPLLAALPGPTVTWIACTVGAVVCLPYTPELVREIGSASAADLWWIAYLGAFPTALGFTTWAYALARTSASRLGVSTYVVPPIAVLLGWWLLGEAPVALAYVGGVLCLLGVYVSRRSSRVTRAPRAPEPRAVERVG